MKKLNSKIIGLTAGLLILSLWSCNDDMQPATESPISENVPVSIYADFTNSYPEATDVTWSISGEYAVASFTSLISTVEASHHSTVWYQLSDNQKRMHSTTIAFADLPAAVTAAFYTGEYAALTPVEYAHVITRYGGSDVDYIYKIQAKGILEGTAATSVKLYYTEDGVLVKLSSEIVYDESFADHDDLDELEEWLPKTPSDFVNAYVNTYYPGARYIYIHEGRNFTKVKILDGHTARLILFSADGSWVSTATEIKYQDIPADILAAFRTSEFAEWHIHNVTEYVTATDGHYYLLSLENGKNKTELRIDATGVVIEDPVTPSQPETPVDPSGNNSYLAKADIEDFIIAKYTGASIIKSDYDDDEAEFEIIYDNHKIKVKFELHPQGYIWSQSEWNFNIKEMASLPVVIVNTLSAKYSDYRLEYLSYIETATDASYYEAGLKSSRTKKTVKIKMDEEGNVIAEYGIR